MTRVWYCANCGYEVTSRGRCHSCREKLTPSALAELRVGAVDQEVGYRIDEWTDRDRGQLIVGLNDLGIEHRFEDDELVIDAGDEDRVDDLVSALGITAEENLREASDDREASDHTEETDQVSDWARSAAGGSPSSAAGGSVSSAESDADDFELDDLDGSETGDVPEADDDLTASLKLLGDAARRLRTDPTDMQADADVAEASAAVFMVDSHGPFGEEAWSAIGRTTRRLLSALGADEAMEDEIRTSAGMLEKLLAPVTGSEVDSGPGTDAGERTVYEMDDWLPDQKAQLGFLLEQALIDYSWNGTELLVPSSRETEVEELFDRIVGGGDDDGSDEDRYKAVAELFAASGRLVGDPTDPIRKENVLRWVRESEGPPLLGMDEVDWFRIRTKARNLATMIEGDGSADDIFGEATQLHDLLRAVV